MFSTLLAFWRIFIEYSEHVPKPNPPALDYENITPHSSPKVNILTLSIARYLPKATLCNNGRLIAASNAWKITGITKRKHFPQ